MLSFDTEVFEVTNHLSSILHLWVIKTIKIQVYKRDSKGSELHQNKNALLYNDALIWHSN